MIYINIKQSEKPLVFKTKIELSKFLQAEKDFIDSFWYKNDNKTLIQDCRVCFGAAIRQNILTNYENIIKDIHNPEFNLELELEKSYKEKKLVYSKDSFIKCLIKERDLKKYKLAIYMLGIYTNNIIGNIKSQEVYELAKIKMHTKPYNNLKPYKVLVIDGGGILGYYEASLLLALDQKFNGINSEETKIGKSFDMICGTSTGSILAAGLAKGVPLSEIKSLYENSAEAIFPAPMPEGKLSKLFWTLKHLYKPSASQEVLKSLLEKTFSDITFSNIWEREKIALCIPAILLDTHSIRVFKTPHTKENEFNNLKLSDACLASSAAPIYFPFAKIEQNTIKRNYVDGGLWANNPILIGLTEALKVTKENQPIEIYSLKPPIRNEAQIDFAKENNPGIIHWKAGINIINLSLFAQSEGNSKIAYDLGKIFTNLGQDINIINFPEGPVIGDFLKSFGLDKNSPRIFNAMENQIISTIENIAQLDNLSKIKNIFRYKNNEEN